MSVHPCAEPRCSALLPVGVSRCADHRRALDLRRGTNYERGYTWEWSKRAELFRQRYPLCGMRPGGRPPVLSQCHDEGRLTPAEQVDHVVPHRGDVDAFWNEEGNWQSLCASCHTRKTTAGL
jgi:5-methylcytosine-specific restriction protein A